MANKTKKISINVFEEVTKSQYDPFYTLEWNGIAITVKHNLTLREMLSFADSVVKNCFQKDGGVFLPEIKNFAIRNGIIEYYTNISLPANIDRKYELLYHSNIVEEVVKKIDGSQFNAMLDAIEDKISHTERVGIEAITLRMNDVCSSFENMVNKIGDVFSDLDKESLTDMVKSISGGFDESKIVRGILSEHKAQTTEYHSADGEK